MKYLALFVFLVNAVAGNALAGEDLFTNSLKEGEIAAKRGDVTRAVAIYNAVRTGQTNNADHLCLLARCYCDLTCLTGSTAFQQELTTRALECAQQAATLDPRNATAHASVAVCYAKSCAFADIKTELAYSRMFKQEAQRAIALDPKQDVAYYLLGRWNYGIASLGLFSRAYVKVVYGELPKASYQDAVAYFQKACGLAPNRILYHSGLAMAYDALGKEKLELAELKTCCVLKPSDLEDVEVQKEAFSKINQMHVNH
ncbi:MAG TPA: hypothetical protein VGY98_01910 [Verrucomicrobiae bacterium]|nr:hypothetical protein [Verrucomicrobiae bacterium]